MGPGTDCSSDLILCSLCSGGSWSQSCSPIAWDGTTLSAYCGATSGSTQLLSSLDYVADCHPGSTVTNYNNALRCDAIGSELPGGSWSASCASTAWDAVSGTLSAVCAPTKTVTQLDYYLCCPGATVSNDEGILRCNCNLSSMPGEQQGGCIVRPRHCVATVK